MKTLNRLQQLLCNPRKEQQSSHKKKITSSLNYFTITNCTSFDYPPATSAPLSTISTTPPLPTASVLNTPSPPTTCIDPMVGVSAATTSRLRNILQFVSTLGFKSPKKSKN
ncbi:uncharacterized protein DS421_2g49410 [Arachis hypogaea]|nr:uncharacterized protein DS421_2g49410 [Arachis hypogaea]